MEAPKSPKPPERVADGTPAPTPTPAPQSQWSVRRFLFGAPRDVQDPRTYHHISLIALLAWVGLGADGLSSSAYGPDEAFRALGEHTLPRRRPRARDGVTVFIISVAYTQIIEHFPFGGGGYVVATKLLGPGVGRRLRLGAARRLRPHHHRLDRRRRRRHLQLPAARAAPPGSCRSRRAAIGLLVVLNLRGVKESVTVLAPIFGLFLVTHVDPHRRRHRRRTCGEVPARRRARWRSGFRAGLAELGAVGLFAVFVRAYSMGAGTYTGIEAVSNGLQIMREPKVQTAQRTMVYMAVSLAVTAGGILLCYLLFRVAPEEGKTMNAVLLERFAGGVARGRRRRSGRGFVVVTLVAEAALLFVAAQAGFIDGPRVMANMAIDSWLPHRFAQLSDRLTMQNGVLLMGGAALATLLWTARRHPHAGGDVLDQRLRHLLALAARHAPLLVADRGAEGRKRGFAIHGVALPALRRDPRRDRLREGRAGRLGDHRRHRARRRRSASSSGATTGRSRRTSGGSTPSWRPSRRTRAARARCSTRSAPTAVLLVGGYGGPRRARAPHRPADLPRLLQELRLRLGRRDRLGGHEGRSRRWTGSGSGPRPRSSSTWTSRTG